MESQALKRELERIDRLQRINILDLQIAAHEGRALGEIRLEQKLLEGMMRTWAEATDVYSQELLGASKGGKVLPLRRRDPRKEPEAGQAFSSLDRVLQDDVHALKEAQTTIEDGLN
ncbi:MAG: hypothetical protein AAB802_04175, partial [Patescibacteria group bacterium]